MNKRIVFCADGTWNGPDETAAPGDIDGSTQKDPVANAEVTNVVKLFVNLRGQVTAESQALRNETEMVCKDPTGATLQVAKYLHGVGDSNNHILKVLGGVFGVGVIARIIRGYTYISRNYEPGDQIYITGFSRGAYTARALAGMIASVGLLNNKTYDVNDKDEAYRRGLEAWIKCKGVVFTGNNRLSGLLNAIVAFAEGVVSRVTVKKGDFIEDVPIRAVGVWDTVGSMGIPDYMKGQRRDVFSFVNETLSPKIARGFHAMALDEERLDFPVTRWVDDPARIEQRWFIGAHADVGGGYKSSECGLSDLALDWMMRKFADEGVLFAEPLIHKPVLTLCTQDFHRPWEKPPFNIGPKKREPKAGDQFDASVKERWQGSPDYQKRWPKLF